MRCNIYEKGKYIILRDVRLEDAEFIVKIRNIESMTKYLHNVSQDTEAQRDWINDQQQREGDIYLILEDMENNKLGLLSIYNVDSKTKTAEFGRWISIGNAVQNLESIIITFDYAFNNLGLKSLHMDTMMDNSKVRRFWKRFGADIEGEVQIGGLALERALVTADKYFATIRSKNISLIDFS